ncbi:MAG TPA: hypothetical protein VMO26_18985 [Vicinamibacterales bacterium]|nr:hypothetical protein [Vicinamibacterales bacterium]
MRGLPGVFVVATVCAVGGAAFAQPPALGVLLERATAYVSEYEHAFSLLVSEEYYVQEIRRPLNPGANLSRANPGGGMQGGDVRSRRVLRSDYLLVQLGAGSGWMPFRDVFELDTGKVRDREDRLAQLFLSNEAERFELADRIMAESTRHNLGNVTRTINIPTLAMMFVHPRVRDRFTFAAGGEELVGGRTVHRVHYRETAKPTLIKTTRGRDLMLEGQLWIDAETGAVVKTALTAADPAVRATVTVTFRRDEALAIWVPEQMDEYYKAYNALDEIFATATYSNVRRFQVYTDEKIRKPPGM